MFRLSVYNGKVMDIEPRLFSVERLKKFEPAPFKLGVVSVISKTTSLFGR